MKWLARAVAAVGIALAAILVPAAASWANHSPAPVPSLAPGQTVVQTAQVCRRDVDQLGSEVGHHCVASAWTVTQPGPNIPNPLPVQEVSPVPGVSTVTVEPGSTPLAVREQSPTTTATLDCSTGCRMEAILSEPQYTAMMLVGASLLMFVLFAVVRREGRAFRA